MCMCYVTVRVAILRSQVSIGSQTISFRRGEGKVKEHLGVAVALYIYLYLNLDIQYIVSMSCLDTTHQL